MNSLPIGVFDSGLGGLTTVRVLSRLLPCEDIVYFGDTGRVPYGNRSRDTINKYAVQDVRFLLQKQVKMIIAACGTVSSVAESVGDNLTVPFTTVVRPAARAAVSATKSGKIGVIATAATIASNSYRKRILELLPGAEVTAQACPLLVPLVESGFVSAGDELARLTVRRYIEPLATAGIDTLILGCTHYPVLRPIMEEMMGKEVEIIDAGEQAAIHAKELLAREELLSPSSKPGKSSFFVSDLTQGFAEIAGILLGSDISEDVTFVNIDSL